MKIILARSKNTARWIKSLPNNIKNTVEEDESNYVLDLSKTAIDTEVEVLVDIAVKRFGAEVIKE